MHTTSSSPSSPTQCLGFVPASYVDDFSREFPSHIVAKYPNPLPATSYDNIKYGQGEYLGPAVMTSIRAIAVQQFEVEDENGATLATLTSPMGRTAYETAVTIAECRGLPWMVSGSGEVFDPATGQRWSHKCFPYLSSRKL